MLRRGDLVDAYRTAMQRGHDRQHQQDAASLRELTGVRFLELTVAEGSQAAGAAISELPWPTSVVVTNVSRDGQTMTPKGMTVLQAGDHAVLLTSHDDAEAARALLGRPDDTL